MTVHSFRRLDPAASAPGGRTMRPIPAATDITVVPHGSSYGVVREQDRPQPAPPEPVTAAAAPVVVPATAGTPDRDGALSPYEAAKRAFDVVFAVTLLIVAAPLMALAAALVRLTSPGPAVFVQVRIGRNGQEFRCYKFRTMVDGAHALRESLADLNVMSGPVFKAPNDPRVTPVGRWLRRTSIDELPQLINVLRGEMSVVGPRPALPEEVAVYSDRQRRRLSVKPGLTCLWQVSGRSAVDFDAWIDLDLDYIERRGFALDMAIVARTVWAVLSCRGAM